ncbi:MAG: hypothetical protein RBT59_08830 [Arcobacteraceae bacterium]|jgi:hypothetical protein|nr:hypothetical protein [Arcobacteraceae bacterium]
MKSFSREKKLNVMSIFAAILVVHFSGLIGHTLLNAMSNKPLSEYSAPYDYRNIFWYMPKELLPEFGFAERTMEALYECHIAELKETEIIISRMKKDLKVYEEQGLIVATHKDIIADMQLKADFIKFEIQEYYDAKANS